MTPLRFKAVQNHCVPWPLPASRCIAIASRLKANPHRAFAAQYRASPSRFDSSQCHCQTMLCSSVLHPCISVHCFAIPLLYRALLLYRELLHSALPNCTLPLPSIANLCISVAFPGASRRLISMPSHRVSLLLNTSPSLCKTSPSGSVAALRQSPLFLCVAEIRIAPQSLRCSSRPKTEFSRAYAIPGRAAACLSVAEPCATSLFLFCTKLNQALPLLYFSSLCISFAVPCGAALRRCFARRAY